MLKKALGMCGVVLFLAGIMFGTHLLFSELRANLLDTQSFQVFGSVPCVSEVDEVAVSKRTMSENESQSITAVLSLVPGQEIEGCEISVTINAPNFEISPPDSKRTISVRPGERTATTMWILTPKKQGTFEVAIDSGYETEVVGITVTNTLGLTLFQAQVFSYLGSLFGPIFTVPWWYEKWQKQKDKRKPKESLSKKR